MHALIIWWTLNPRKNKKERERSEVLMHWEGSSLKNISANENAGIVTNRHISDHWYCLISFLEE